ncbi:MAG: transcriptional regulator [Firmicutes bacterium]|nr:transcriptional regulator [Bacillota bacterium]
MSLEERREREKEEMRKLILDAAAEIIFLDGIDKLSIRKIAERIEYSPSIIYHYFNNKDNILNQLMSNAYQKIITALSSAKLSSDHPVERLKDATRNYIETALSMPNEYNAAQLNSSPDVLKYTASLFRGATNKNPALAFLCDCLKDIHKNAPRSESEIELMAQMIVIAAFGLIMRLNVEAELEEKQKYRLIDHFVNVTILQMAGIYTNNMPGGKSI